MDLEITITLSQCLAWVGIGTLILVLAVIMCLFIDVGRIK
jgi:hypothetical protein